MTPTRIVSQRSIASAARLLLACFVLCAGTARARGGTLVEFDMGARGTFYIDLFDDLMSDTVANFLNYVGDNDYQNTLVHRSTSIADSGIAVIQGGGYNYNSQTGQFVHIATDSPIALDFNLSNKRGTIAMARTAAPNSATSEWFINTVDNPALDTPGNQYAVFGWVVGTGMSVVDGINTLPKSNVSGFSNVPLQNYGGGAVNESNLVIANNITVSVADHPSYQNPWMNTDVINDGILKANDALEVINELLINGSHALDGPFAATSYLDVNGTNTVTAGDAIDVINALLQLDAQQAAPMEGLVARAPRDDSVFAMNAVPLTVPEPASLITAGIALCAFLGFAVRRRRVSSASRG